MSDVYFIQVSGADQEMLDSAAEQAGDLELDDNIVLVPEEMEPMNRAELVEYLDQLADVVGASLEMDDDE